MPSANGNIVDVILLYYIGNTKIKIEYEFQYQINF